MSSPSPHSDAQPTLDNTTLFIRNLSPSTTHADLESHFSGLAPVRHAFVCTSGDGDASRCRGFGFVQFTNSDDAAAAARSLNGSVLHHRRIHAEPARRRNRSGGRGAAAAGDADPAGDDGAGVASNGNAAARSAPPAQKKDGKKVRGALAGSLAMRTVLVRPTGEGASAVSEAAVKRRALGDGVDDADVGLVEVIPAGGSGGAVRAVFSSWPQAGKGAARLHGNGWDAEVEGLIGGKRCRVIVRNLPFDVAVAEMREVFARAGPLRKLHLPKPGEGAGSAKWRKMRGESVEDDAVEEDGKTRTAGYGFVEYFLPAHANHAIVKINGSKFGGRVVAVDLAVSKKAYDARAAEDVEAFDASDEGNVAGAERNTAGVGGDDGASEDDDDDIVGGSESKADGTAAGGAVVQRREGKSTPEEMERTVFVRNLLFETSQQELRDAMSELGQVEQAVLVMDPVSGRPRGTAFVRFRDAASVDAAVSAAGGGTSSTQPTPLAMGGGGGLVVGGRPLLISKAVDRSKAKELVSEANPKNRKKVDSRNLRLAWVGHVKPNTQEAAGLSEDDLKKRAKAEKDKRAKLSHNPNAFVSDVRLSVRNLPRDFDEKMLKHMFICGASSKESPSVKIDHVKVVRDDERNGRSKGYGFVLFKNHVDAMKALEKLNNNPKVLEQLIKANPKALKIDTERARVMRKAWGNDRRLIVEFSVEDRRQVRIIEQIKSRGQEKSAAIASERAAGQSSTASKDTKKRKPDSLSKAAKRAQHKGAKRLKIESQEAGDNGKNPKSSMEQDESSREGQGAGARQRKRELGVSEAEGKEPKAKKSKRRVPSAKNDANEEKFQGLVDSYKRKLQKSKLVAEAPMWFN